MFWLFFPCMAFAGIMHFQLEFVDAATVLPALQSAFPEAVLMAEGRQLYVRGDNDVKAAIQKHIDALDVPSHYQLEVLREDPAKSVEHKPHTLILSLVDAPILENHVSEEAEYVWAKISMEGSTLILDVHGRWADGLRITYHAAAKVNEWVVVKDRKKTAWLRLAPL